MVKFFKLPDGTYVRVKKEKSFGTVATRGESGRFTGRKAVKGKGDGTGINRVVEVRATPDKRGHIRILDAPEGGITGRW